MPCYLVAYDAASDELETELALMPGALVPLGCKKLWIVESKMLSSRRLASHLEGFGVPHGAKLIVASLRGGFGGVGLSETVDGWFQNHTF